MVTSIQLGNLFNSNGRTIITGGNSALDVEGLVKGLTEARRQPAVILEGKVEVNTKRSEALAEMQKLLQDFRDAADFLRNPPGVRNAAENVFRYRKAAVSSNGAIPGSTYLNVTAEPGAPVGRYNINVGQIATRNIQTTNTFSIATPDTALVGNPGGPLNAGTLSIGAAGINVTLNAGDTLSQVASKINSVKNQSGVEATVIKISDGNYRLSFKTLETGTAQNYDIVAQNPGMWGIGFSIQSPAVDAEISLDGTTVTRSNNSINDLVDGLTFNLLAATPVATTLEINIESDRELAKQGIVNFVDSYNAFRLFVSRQTELGTNGRPTKDAVLASNSALSLSSSRVNIELSRFVDGLAASDPSRLADIGITLSDYPGDNETPFTRNILTINEEKLNSAIESNFEAVRRVFEFDMTADDANLTVFSRSNGLGVSRFTLNVDQVAGTYTATFNVNGVPTVVSLEGNIMNGGDGVVLTGKRGTVLEGLTLIYASSSNATIDVNISQGIGDRVFNALEDMLTKDSGVVSSALQQVEKESKRYEEEISKIDDQIKRYRDRLIEQFSALERTISQINNLLQSLDAQANARNNS
jgi:flagellar hook-associated protein 2